MKNLLKYCVLTILTLFVGAFLYFQPRAEAINFVSNQEVVVETPKVIIETTTEADSKTSIVSKIDPINLFETGKTFGSETAAVGMAFKATCYCLRGKTASGAMVRRGIVAADPRILPLGTRISLSNAGRYSGNYLVADTGGVIKGRILDIWVPSCGEAIGWGRRGVTVTILGRGGKSPVKKAKKAIKTKA
jgi:3D (Asp-Asp-Asp) domain-containing protein